MTDLHGFVRLTAPVCTISLFAMAVSAASTASEPVSGKDFDQSVSVYSYQLMGVVANYEQQTTPHQAWVGEAAYGLFGHAKGTWSLGMSYRYHFRPGLDGFFVGVFGRYGEVRNAFKLDVDGDKQRFHVESPLALVGIDFLGYRLQRRNGWTTVFRAGYGVPLYENFQWSPQPSDQQRRFHEGLYGLDLELSTGFSF